MLNERQCTAACDKQASKRSSYEAKWADYEERKSNLQKREVPLWSLSEKEYGRTHKSEIGVMCVKTTLFSCRHSSLSLATP